jgi:hypothetical protein
MESREVASAAAELPGADEEAAENDDLRLNPLLESSTYRTTLKMRLKLT